MWIFLILHWCCLYKMKEVKQIRRNIYWFLIDSHGIPGVSHQSFAYWVEKRGFMQRKKTTWSVCVALKLLELGCKRKTRQWWWRCTHWKAMKCRFLFIALPQFTCAFPQHTFLFEPWRHGQVNLIYMPSTFCHPKRLLFIYYTISQMQMFSNSFYDISFYPIRIPHRNEPAPAHLFMCLVHFFFYYENKFKKKNTQRV